MTLKVMLNFIILESLLTITQYPIGKAFLFLLLMVSQ
jgi:hypothetical protein